MYIFRKMLKIILFCLCMAACNDKENEYSVILPEQEQESDVPQNDTELMNKTVKPSRKYPIVHNLQYIK